MLGRSRAEFGTKCDTTLSCYAQIGMTDNRCTRYRYQYIGISISVSVYRYQYIVISISVSVYRYQYIGISISVSENQYQYRYDIYVCKFKLVSVWARLNSFNSCD